VLSFALGARQERHTRERLAETLQGAVTIGDLDLALVRGHLVIEGVAVTRDDAVGHLSLTAGDVRCELLPLGLALFDRDCQELAVRHVRLEVSSAALFKLHRPATRPIHTERLVIDDATLVFQPSAVLPNLGQIEVAIDHAEAGATTLRTPVSWLFSLRVLQARFALPAGITMFVHYEDGVLTASGSLFGSQPVAIPLALPAADTAQDAHDEMRLLFELGRKTAERLAARRVEDWLRQKIR
jgi:hypothetical protein